MAYIYRFGRDNFQEAMKIANRDIAHASWKDFKYMVFDMPKHEGTYEERFNALGMSLLAQPHYSYLLTPVTTS